MSKRHKDQLAKGTVAGGIAPWRRHRRANAEEKATRASSSINRAPGAGHDQGQFIVDALNNLRSTVVGEIMTPRVDVVGLSIPVTADDVTRAVKETGHSCFPVYDDNLDDLIGVLFVNDLFRAGWKVESGRQSSRSADATPSADNAITDPIDISRRLRQPFLVPESGLVLDVLAEMRRQQRAFGVVVDEHGGVEGVLTIKNILSALVGDLYDEFDPDDEPDMVRVDESRWLVDGRTSVDDVRDRLGIDLPDGEYVTFAGFLFDAFGDIPSEGDNLSVDGWELRVAEMDKRRVAKVVVKRATTKSDASEDGIGEGRAGSEQTPVG